MKVRFAIIVLLLTALSAAARATGGFAEVAQGPSAAAAAITIPEQDALPLDTDADFKTSPIMFEENVGQRDEFARFTIWGEGGALTWLAEDGIWLNLEEPRPPEDIYNLPAQSDEQPPGDA